MTISQTDRLEAFREVAALPPGCAVAAFCFPPIVDPIYARR
ncbi:hypothetical protein THTE_2512 [Thermogutta terrifontis]|uniref:Uncharacterized protein n=1 Tax=Thermogutta terrifontis TaxID=1331910 RepID=A0A286RGM2_9BACT|nr:hypothetical protein THTE_2512 [Thermogutta terrifontis]